MTRVLVWYENQPLPEAVDAERAVYPNGVHGALGNLFAAQRDMQVRTATMQDAGQGLGDEALQWADVLVYFSHKHWRDVTDERVDAAQRRVLGGMGLVLLHSAHASKLFSRLLGTRDGRAARGGPARAAKRRRVAARVDGSSRAPHRQRPDGRVFHHPQRRNLRRIL
jgi:trehalose utilization protein